MVSPLSAFATFALSVFVCVALLAAPSSAYIPALPSNDTASLVANTQDTSSLELKWASGGRYSEFVSYQLAGQASDDRPPSTGLSKGALVKFAEKDLIRHDHTRTPWIALVNCDINATTISPPLSQDEVEDQDIFTKLQERGALAALLYSMTSETCLINAFYRNTSAFTPLLDIFTMKRQSQALLVLSQFGNINKTMYDTFNSTRLNAAQQQVNDSLLNSQPNISPYLVAHLRAWNSTEEDDPMEAPSDDPPATGSGSSPNTSLAMIILYTITGCVCALFVIVILTGAVRAFRNPERYGPRAYDPTVEGPGGQAQTRAAGITRAILDTFPVVKFGRNESPAYPYPDQGKQWDPEDIELASTAANSATILRSSANPSGHLQRHASTSRSEQRRSGSQNADTPSGGDGGVGAVDPAAIGRETCPICIVDFEEGDDLRILPCEGQHRFHRDCVDPWLLELSSSCPICRQDFQALESIVAREDGNSTAEGFGRHQPPSSSTTLETPPSSTPSRFSKYLSFARKRKSERDSLNGRPAQPSPRAE